MPSDYYIPRNVLHGCFTELTAAYAYIAEQLERTGKRLKVHKLPWRRSDFFIVDEDWYPPESTSVASRIEKPDPNIDIRVESPRVRGPVAVRAVVDQMREFKERAPLLELGIGLDPEPEPDDLEDVI